MDDSSFSVEAPKPASTAWMVTFADMISLLLTFFVMLFSMSTVASEKWEDIVYALEQNLNPGRKTLHIEPSSSHDIRAVYVEPATDLVYLATVLQEQIVKNPVLSRSHITEYERYLLISLPGDILFDRGTANITRPARQALFTLGGLLRNLQNQIDVVGHTDPLPLEGTQFTSNWELSLARAIAVSEELRHFGYTKKIVPYGQADAKFENLSLSLPESERFEAARRVDIVIREAIGGN
ncbi:MAG: flagellar motor protein MotB [Alphaproteobacteria bacterium]|nr:flagellar motor protein MotB [Alphaproteobacteria bacterium]